MNRRDFIKAFSAGTTLAAATSLANIVEAKPVIKTLEKKIILPGDSAFEADWVFGYVGYFKHEYELVNAYSIGTDVPGNFAEILKSIPGDVFRFTFELKNGYFARYNNPFFGPDRLSEHVETFLSSHTFEARKSDLEIGEISDEYDSDCSLVISNVKIAGI